MSHRVVISSHPSIAIVSSLIVVLAAVGGAPTAAHAETAGPAQAADVAPIDAVTSQVNATPDNTSRDRPTNETPRHRNPDEVSEPGNLAALEGVLGRSLDQKLGNSTVAIDREQYETARELLGDDYDDRLDQYATVTEDMDAESRATAFEETRDAQVTYANETERFESTYAEYQRAREANETERARELARELDQSAAAVNDSAEQLRAAYLFLENATGTDQADRVTTINQTRESVLERAETVREAEFVGTTITATTNRTNATIRNSVSITGQLVDEADEPLRNAQVTLGAAEQLGTTRTDANGSFTLRYRPTPTTEAGEQPLSLAYDPDPQSQYRASSDTLAVRVDPVAPAINISTTPERAAFDTPVTTAGAVTASVDGDPIAGVPLEIVVGGATLERTTTGPDGEFSLAPSLPETIPEGTATVAVRVADSGLAVGNGSATDTISIGETETQIQVDRTPDSTAASLRLTGTLRTDAGTAVPNQPVRIAINGTSIGTAETDANGSFSVEPAVPPDVDGAGESDVTLAVTASFDGSGTNLRDTAVSETITVPRGPDPTASDGSAATLGSAIGPAADNIVFTVLGAVVAGLAAVVLVWLLFRRFRTHPRIQRTATWLRPLTDPLWRRISPVVAAITAIVEIARHAVSAISPFDRDLEPDASDSDAPESDAPPNPDPDADTPATPRPDPIESALQTALDAYDSAEYDRSAVLAYGAVRQSLRRELGISDSATHWECYTEAVARGLPDRSEPHLKTITEAFERAEYAPRGSLDSDAGSAVISASRELISEVATTADRPNRPESVPDGGDPDTESEPDDS